MHFSSIIIQGQPLTLADITSLGLAHETFEWSDTNPDLFQIISDENTIGIDSIKLFIEWSGKQPFNSTNKVGIIWQAEKLTVEAQNALLKTLEEPPQNTQIVLATQNISSLLATIISRCQIIDISAKQSRVVATDKNIDSFLAGNYIQKLELLQDIEERIEAERFLLNVMRRIVETKENYKISELNSTLEAAKACYVGLKAGTSIKLTLLWLAISMVEE